MPSWAPSSNRAQGSDRVEAPVTVRGYLLCVFAAFGGILFGYDSGYISGVLAMNAFKRNFGGAYWHPDVYPSLLTGSRPFDG
jgi:hypothetical protein